MLILINYWACLFSLQFDTVGVFVFTNIFFYMLIPKSLLKLKLGSTFARGIELF